MSRIPVLLAILTACTQAPAPAAMAVDQCALREYFEECSEEAAGPEQLASCRLKAAREALRIAAGIPPECRNPQS